jgi:endonuclease III
MGARLDLPRLAAALRATYGPPVPPPPQNAFEWILWDNVAYLADDETRALAFAELRERVGLTPAAVLRASLADLEMITAHGILAPRFAGKLRLAAERALADCAGDVDAAVRAAFAHAPARAIELLVAFPSVGRPGAERILLFMGLLPVLALDSHGLRVLHRVGAAAEQRTYDATYRAVRSAVDDTGPQPPALLRELHLLLQTHGRRTCRRTSPDCPSCALRAECAYAAAAVAIPVGVPLARPSLLPNATRLPPA